MWLRNVVIFPLQVVTEINITLSIPYRYQAQRKGIVVWTHLVCRPNPSLSRRLLTADMANVGVYSLNKLGHLTYRYKAD